MKGFEGWRHARQLEDELLDTLEDGLGADDINLATLRSSWMVYWLAGWPQRHQGSRDHALEKGKHWSVGASSKESSLP